MTTTINDLAAAKATHMSKRYQANLRIKNVARFLANQEEKSNLSSGKAVDRPMRGLVKIQQLTLGDGTYNRSKRTDAKETLTIDQWTMGNVIYSKDEIAQVLQNEKRINMDIDSVSQEINRHIDRSFFEEVEHAAYEVNLGTLSKSNMYDAFMEPFIQLSNAGAEEGKLVACPDPWLVGLISEYMADRKTDLGDKMVSKVFGHRGVFANFHIFQATQSLKWTCKINIATNPTDGDTITLDGVKLTFVSALSADPAVAGEVLIEASAAATVDNLVSLINNPTTTSAKHTAIGSDDDTVSRISTDVQSFLKSGQILIKATDATTSVVITSRKGRITAAETFTDTTDNISDCYLHVPFMAHGSVDMVFQKDLVVEPRLPDGRLAREFNSDILWGKKTFTEGAEKMCNAKVKTQDDTASA